MASEIEASYEKKVEAIKARRKRHLDRGRCLIDVCKETRDAIKRAQDWRQTQLRKINGKKQLAILRREVKEETLRNVSKYLRDTGQVIPDWAFLLLSK